MEGPRSTAPQPFGQGETMPSSSDEPSKPAQEEKPSRSHPLFKKLLERGILKESQGGLTSSSPPAPVAPPVGSTAPLEAALPAVRRATLRPKKHEPLHEPRTPPVIPYHEVGDYVQQPNGEWVREKP